MTRQYKYINMWLDDERPAPDGWEWFKTHSEFVFRMGEITASILKDDDERFGEISLDHDLGDDEHGTGYDTIVFIEELVHGEVLTKETMPTKISIHTANPSARVKMELARNSIYKMIGSIDWMLPTECDG